jgi:hypothetical protein
MVTAGRGPCAPRARNENENAQPGGRDERHFYRAGTREHRAGSYAPCRRPTRTWAGSGKRKALHAGIGLA